MNYEDLIKETEKNYNFKIIKVAETHPDEVYIDVSREYFKIMCMALHKSLKSPVMTLFAVDEKETRNEFAPLEKATDAIGSDYPKDDGGFPPKADPPQAEMPPSVHTVRERDSLTGFAVLCAFMGVLYKKWFFVRAYIDRDNPRFDSLSKDIYSASLFEREMKEMFGIELTGTPDVRRLRLHDEVWPENAYPLRKDFHAPESCADISGNKNKPVEEQFSARSQYVFKKIEGEGVFEVSVGPVHAGIIGPGHFRFSCAGEPIINLEIRLGFTHRGVEKLFENKKPEEAVKISECVCGDASFSHSLAYCRAVEKISGIAVSEESSYLRAIFLELERMFNHAADMGGIAIDVGFSFPSAYASIIKESLLVLNETLTGNRYLKGINVVGGVTKYLNGDKKEALRGALKNVLKDFGELKKILLSSVSFMDRVDTTGVLKKNIAEDLGVVGLAGRASGIQFDLRKDFPGVYEKVKFNIAYQEKGDVLARLNVRIAEFEESVSLIKQLLDKLPLENRLSLGKTEPREGTALGYSEGWRGPVLYWVRINKQGLIERCKITDPSFHNWLGLSYAAPGNIIPDFPLCNKSFDLSYAGNDL